MTETDSSRTGNHLRGEPALIDTRIDIRSPRVAQQLQAKLAEYRQRNIEKSEMSYEERIAQFGTSEYRNIFKESILDAVLTIGGDEERNFTANPIVITEIALAVQDETRLPVVSAATVPFVFNSDALVYAPDFERAPRDPVISGFLNAYMVIKTYASGETFSVDSGTGLPILPIAPERS